MSKSGKIALGGLLTALGVVLMFLTGLIPIGTYALPAIAGVLLIVAVIGNRGEMGVDDLCRGCSAVAAVCRG